MINRRFGRGKVASEKCYESTCRTIWFFRGPDQSDFPCRSTSLSSNRVQGCDIAQKGISLDNFEQAYHEDPLRNRGVGRLNWWRGAVIRGASRKFGRAFLLAFQALVLSPLLFVLFTLTLGIGVSVFSDVAFLIFQKEVELCCDCNTVPIDEFSEMAESFDFEQSNRNSKILDSPTITAA
jgi:hypothetical protein